MNHTPSIRYQFGESVDRRAAGRDLAHIGCHVCRSEGRGDPRFPTVGALMLHYEQAHGRAALARRTSPSRRLLAAAWRAVTGAALSLAVVAIVAFATALVAHALGLGVR